MGIFSIWLVFVLLGTDLKPATAHNNVTVEISIFYNASDRYMPNILQNAEDMFLTCHQEKKPRKENLNVQINRQWLDEAEIAGNEIRITHSLFNVWNISLRTQGAIFVDINSNSLFLSSMLERSAIPTVGIFQTREQQRTQVGFLKMKLNNVVESVTQVQTSLYLNTTKYYMFLFRKLEIQKLGALLFV